MAAVPAAQFATRAVRTASWQIIYQGTNITTNLLKVIREIIYKDKAAGASTELEIKVEDRDKSWQRSTFPRQSDQLALSIGYVGEALMDCGTYQVDEFEVSGDANSGDVFTLRCLETFITPALRTPTHAGYTNSTLSQIAGQVAARHNLALVAAPDAIDVQFSRVTQQHETDLAFLHRIAREHNYDFSVRNNQLVFYARTTLEDAPAVATIVRAATTKFNFKTKTQGSIRTYAHGQINYFDPDSKQLISQTEDDSTNETGDTAKAITRVDNGQQATLKAQGLLHGANMLQTMLTINGPGRIDFRAGHNIVIDGWGVMDGTYLVTEMRHKLDGRNSYTTEFEGRRGAAFKQKKS